MDDKQSTTSSKEIYSRNIQDKKYTDNSQVTFFKTTHQKYSNFAEEDIELTLNDATFGSVISTDLSKYQADLLRKIHVKIKIGSVNPGTSKFAWIRRLGHALIDRVSITCQGTVYDTHYGTWLDVWNEISCSESKQSGYSKLIGDVEQLTNYDTTKKPEYVMLIPLIFWFNQNPESAFPIVSSRFSPFIVTLNISDKTSMFISDDDFDSDKVTISEISLIVKLTYVDNKEKKLLIQKPQEYLMDKLEFNGIERYETVNKNYILSFDRPTRELIWCIKNGNYVSGNKFIYYSNKNDWNVKTKSGYSPLQEAATKIISESISTLINTDDPDEPPGPGIWIKLDDNTSYVFGSITITNNFGNKIWYSKNTIGYSANNVIVYLNSKISLDVIVSAMGNVFTNVSTTITVEELSIPVKLMVDTRYNAKDPKVYQFNNYGVMIDGSVSPLIDCGLKYGGLSRFEVQSSDYFSDIVKINKHTNVGKTGIYVYSFATEPELSQPTGTDMLSTSIPAVLSTTMKKYQQLNYPNSTNQYFVFGRSIALLRLINGRSALANK